MNKKLSDFNPFARRDFIKATGGVSLGFAVYHGIFTGCRPVSESVLGIPDPGEFLNPGGDQQGVPFLFFNDDIKAEESVRQLKEMQKAGWGKVLPRRYGGLLNATYEKTWNVAVREVIKASKELGVNLKLKVYSVFSINILGR